MKKLYTSGGFELTRKSTPEQIVREAFVKTVIEILDAWGIENDSIERIQGAVEFIKQFVELEEAIDKLPAINEKA